MRTDQAVCTCLRLLQNSYKNTVRPRCEEDSERPDPHELRCRCAITVQESLGLRRDNTNIFGRLPDLLHQSSARIVHRPTSRSQISLQLIPSDLRRLLLSSMWQSWRLEFQGACSRIVQGKTKHRPIIETFEMTALSSDLLPNRERQFKAHLPRC